MKKSQWLYFSLLSMVLMTPTLSRADEEIVPIDEPLIDTPEESTAISYEDPNVTDHGYSDPGYSDPSYSDPDVPGESTDIADPVDPHINDPIDIPQPNDPTDPIDDPVDPMDPGEPSDPSDQPESLDLPEGFEEFLAQRGTPLGDTHSGYHDGDINKAHKAEKEMAEESKKSGEEIQDYREKALGDLAFQISNLAGIDAEVARIEETLLKMLSNAHRKLDEADTIVDRASDHYERASELYKKTAATFEAAKDLKSEKDTIPEGRQKELAAIAQQNTAQKTANLAHSIAMKANEPFSEAKEIVKAIQAKLSEAVIAEQPQPDTDDN